MARFKYYTIYRCRNCGERIRVHGKLASKLVLPPGVHMCCTLPRLARERQVLISEFEAAKQKEQPDTPKDSTKQKRLVDYSKD